MLACSVLAVGQVESEKAAPRTKPAADVLAVDFIERSLKDGQTLRLTLPDGRLAVGKVGRLEKSGDRMALVEGQIQHPEPGSFHFERQTADGKDILTGSMRFAASPTQWKIVPTEGGPGFRWIEAPADDAFRPPVQAMPANRGGSSKTRPSRTESEAALKEGLKIEPAGPGKLRVGTVEIDQTARTVRIPAQVNMRSGDVEYALVHSQGKCHESVFSTEASPPTTGGAFRTSSRVASASASASRARSRCRPSSSCATSRSRPSTSPSRRK